MIQPLVRDPNVVDIEELINKEKKRREAVKAVERASWKSFWGQLEPTKKEMLIEAIIDSGQYDIFLRREK